MRAGRAIAATPQQIRLGTFRPVSGLMRCLYQTSCVPFPEP